jgi:hypothetical protein
MWKHLPWLFLLLSASALAVKIDQPGEAEHRSSHIVTGQLLKVTSTVSTNQDHETTSCAGQLRVEGTEKGEGLKPGDVIRIHYLGSIRWTGIGHPPPGPGGHSNIPAVGEKRRVYLIKRGDGEFDVFYFGGFRLIK